MKMLTEDKVKIQKCLSEIDKRRNEFQSTLNHLQQQDVIVSKMNESYNDLKEKYDQCEEERQNAASDALHWSIIED